MLDAPICISRIDWKTVYIHYNESCVKYWKGIGSRYANIPSILFIKSADIIPLKLCWSNSNINCFPLETFKVVLIEIYLNAEQMCDGWLIFFRVSGAKDFNALASFRMIRITWQGKWKFGIFLAIFRPLLIKTSISWMIVEIERF